MRSFHATEEAGSEAQCESLGFSDEQLRVCFHLLLVFIFFLLFYSACYFELYFYELLFGAGIGRSNFRVQELPV